MAVNGKQKFVIDASVVLAWIMPDETVVEEVDNLFKRMTKGDIDFVAPALLIYEVWSGIRNAILKKRIDLDIAKKVIDKFFKLDIELVLEKNEGEAVLVTAVKRNLSIYDASYEVLAKNLKCKLVSFDGRLV